MTRAKFTIGMFLIAAVIFFGWSTGFFYQVRLIIDAVYFHDNFLLDAGLYLILIVSVCLFTYVILRGLFAWGDAKAKGRMTIIEITYHRWQKLRGQKMSLINRYQRGDLERDQFRKLEVSLQQEIDDAYMDWCWAGDPKVRTQESDDYLKDKYL